MNTLSVPVTIRTVKCIEIGNGTRKNFMSRSNQEERKPIADRDYVLTFGKYKGESLDDILETNPQYLVWLHLNSEFFELSSELLDEAEENATTTVTESYYNKRYGGK
jgi:hypothetical protein